MKRPLAVLVSLLVSTLAGGPLVSAARAQSSNSNSALMPTVNGSVSFGPQKAAMTHLYFRRQTTDHGPTLLVLFSNQPLSVRALNDHQALVQLARKGTFLGLSVEIDERGEMRETELFHREGPFSAPWKFEPANPPSATVGRIITEEEGEFFGQRYAIAVNYRIEGTADDAWRGSPFLETRLTPLALGRAEGWMERLSRKTHFTHAIAVIETDLFGGAGEKSILFSTEPITDEMLASPIGPEAQLHQAGKPVLRVCLDPKGEVRSVTAPAEEGRMATFSSTQWTLELARTEAMELDGTLQSEESGLGSEYPSLQLRFHAAIKQAGAPAPVTAETGRPLPKDGGEPGKAYRDFTKAIKSARRIEDLLPLRVASMGAELTAIPAAERAEFLRFVKSQAAKPLRIVGGFVNEKQATLWLEGGERAELTRGRVNLHLVDGTWKMGAELYRVTDGEL